MSGGCPNTCDVTVSQAVSHPPLPECIALAVKADSCNCGVDVHLENRCNSDLVVSEFLPGSCDDCGGVRASTKASFDKHLTNVGHTDFSIAMQQDGRSHALTFSSNVARFDGGCSMSGGEHGSAAIFAVAALAVALCIRRR